MFNSFRRKLPEITVFHRPTSPSSSQAVQLLRSALSQPYPPTQPSTQSGKGKPLDFDLQVIESPPNADQLTNILSYLPSPATNPSLALLSAHYSTPTGAERPTSVKAIAELAEKNPNALRYPIVVNWLDGQASIGDVDGVKRILEALRKKRDGEIPE